MRNIAQTILLSAGILLSLTGCQKGTTVGGGKDVKFKASANNLETRTAFGDVVTENNLAIQRIDWKSGDKLLIWSDNAIVRENLSHPSFSSNNTHIATYSVSNIREEGRKSVANIEDPAGLGLRYLDDPSLKYAFWGIYPAGAVTANPSVNNSAELTLYDTQTGVEPDMNQAFMTAVALNTEAEKPVELQFYPAFTTFEFILQGGDDDDYSLTITKFALESEGEGGTDLAGKFIASCPNGTWTYDCEDEGNSRLINVTFPEPLTITKGTTASFRFFAFPQDLTNLRITFWTNEGTKSTKLMKKGSVNQNTGDAGIGDDLDGDDVVQVQVVEALDFEAVDHQQGRGTAVDGADTAGGDAIKEVGADGFDILVHRPVIEPGLVGVCAVADQSAAAAAAEQQERNCQENCFFHIFQGIICSSGLSLQHLRCGDPAAVSGTSFDAQKIRSVRLVVRVEGKTGGMPAPEPSEGFQ